MRVLLIHQAFVGPNEAGGTRHYELAVRSIERGYEFTVIASPVSYLTGKASSLVDGNSQGGRLRVLRAYAPATLHRGFLWRILSFISFMLSSVLLALSAGPVDLVMGTSPPMFQAVSAWFVAFLRRRPFLLEIRDLWPAFAVEMGVLTNPILIRLAEWLERFLYARADHLLVNSPAYRDYLLARGIAPAKIAFIPNGVDVGMFDPAARGEDFRHAWHLDGCFVITYAGALGPANDIDTILRTARRLQGQPDIRFVLLGDGKDRARLQALCDEWQLDTVLFIGTTPKSAMPLALAAADLCVATLKDIPMFSTTYPNKVFDYMAAGRPTLLAIDGVIRQVIEEAQGGIFVSPGDDQALAAAVTALYGDRDRAHAMGSSARTYVAERFDRDQQAEAFVDLLQALGHKEDAI